MSKFHQPSNFEKVCSLFGKFLPLLTVVKIRTKGLCAISKSVMHMSLPNIEFEKFQQNTEEIPPLYIKLYVKQKA